MHGLVPTNYFQLRAAFLSLAPSSAKGYYATVCEGRSFLRDAKFLCHVLFLSTHSLHLLESFHPVTQCYNILVFHGFHLLLLHCLAPISSKLKRHCLGGSAGCRVTRLNNGRSASNDLVSRGEVKWCWPVRTWRHGDYVYTPMTTMTKCRNT